MSIREVIDMLQELFAALIAFFTENFGGEAAEDDTTSTTAAQ